MVARDIRVEFPPQTLDPVVIRRVGRQKVQHDAPNSSVNARCTSRLE
jgi:hypothetical protein